MERRRGDPAPQAGARPEPSPTRAAPSLREPTSARVVSPLRVEVPRLDPTSKVIRLIDAAEQKGASDIHFHSGAPPALRIEGNLHLASNIQLDVQEQERLLLGLLTDVQRTTFREEADLDFALVLPSGLRVRANLYRTQWGVDATFRLVRRRPPTLAELGLPEALARFTSYHQGMVLVTGPAGSGKSTTLAALVDLINAERAEHILCLEDPIEIVHPAKKALVNQRQVRRDTESFARALRGALREDPDVIVIGELRDRETISLAVTAAETGHLVLGSMHTNSAARTVARILDAFPPAQQSQVRTMVSESLRGVISQRLVSGVSGKRVAATEILLVTPAISNLIREGKLFQIKSVMQTGRQLGMRGMDDALRELVLEGKVSVEEARKVAENPASIGAPGQGTVSPTPGAAPATLAGPRPRGKP